MRSFHWLLRLTSLLDPEYPGLQRVQAASTLTPVANVIHAEMTRAAVTSRGCLLTAHRPVTNTNTADDEMMNLQYRARTSHCIRTQRILSRMYSYPST